MSPGIGLMKRRLEKESDAISLAKSGVIKKFKIESKKIQTLLTIKPLKIRKWLTNNTTFFLFL